MAGSPCFYLELPPNWSSKSQTSSVITQLCASFSLSVKENLTRHDVGLRDHKINFGSNGGPEAEGAFRPASAKPSDIAVKSEGHFLPPGLTSSEVGASGLGSCSLGKELDEASTGLLMSFFPGSETLKTSGSVRQHASLSSPQQMQPLHRVLKKSSHNNHV